MTGIGALGEDAREAIHLKGWIVEIDAWEVRGAHSREIRCLMPLSFYRSYSARDVRPQYHEVFPVKVQELD